MTTCKKLKKNIIEATRGKLNPYKDPFQPKDLKLIASNYGSFSDHCAKNTTISSRWCGCGLLERVKSTKPYKYILIK